MIRTPIRQVQSLCRWPIRLTIRKEREQWQRQQAAEDCKWARDEQHRNKQELYNIYCNCLQHLSLILAECRLNPGERKVTDEIDYVDAQGTEHPRVVYIMESISEEEKRYRQGAQNWLWLLMLHLRSFDRSHTAQFEYDLNHFAKVS